MSDYRIVLDTAELEKCMSEAASDELAKACEAGKDVGVAVRKAEGSSAHLPSAPVVTYNLSKDIGQAKSLPLPVPIADVEGGLFTSILVRPELDYVEAKDRKSIDKTVPRLSSKSRLTVSLQGSRLDTLEKPQATGW